MTGEPLRTIESFLVFLITGFWKNLVAAAMELLILFVLGYARSSDSSAAEVAALLFLFTLRELRKESCGPPVTL